MSVRNALRAMTLRPRVTTLKGSEAMNRALAERAVALKGLTA